MRDINQLHPSLIDKVYELIDLCEKNGITIGISECLRTTDEQDALYAKGRTTSGSIVTNCKGSTYSSMHQWGVAFDFYLKMDVDNDGSTSDDSYNNATGLFDKVGALGQSIGLEWGGSWTSIVDRPHFQLPDWGSTATKLKSAYGTPEAFFKTWSASESTTTTSTATTASTTTTSTNKVYAVVTTSSGLNIRSTPSTSGSSNKVGAIPYKKTCEVVKLDAATGSGITWAQVAYGGVTGYVAQKYLNVTSSTTNTTTSAESSSKSYSKSTVASAMSSDEALTGTYTTTANLNLRNAPGTKGTSVILTIPKGDKVQNYKYYTPKDDIKWLLVSYGKYTGYVSYSYLNKVK